MSIKAGLRKTVSNSPWELLLGIVMIVVPTLGILDQRLLPVPEQIDAAVIGFGLALLYDAYSKAELREALAALRSDLSDTRKTVSRSDRAISETRTSVDTLARDEVTLRIVRENSAFSLGVLYTDLVLWGPPPGLAEQLGVNLHGPPAKAQLPARSRTPALSWDTKQLPSSEDPGASSEGILRKKWRTLLRIADSLDARACVVDTVGRVLSGDWPGDSEMLEKIEGDHVGEWYIDEFIAVDTAPDIALFLSRKFGDRVRAAFNCGIGLRLVKKRLGSPEEAYAMLTTRDSRGIGLACAMDSWGVDYRLIHATEKILFPKSRPQLAVVRRFFDNVDTVLHDFGSIRNGQESLSTDLYQSMIGLDEIEDPAGGEFAETLDELGGGAPPTL